MTKQQKNIIKTIEETVKKEFADDSTGHDWWHADRVRRTALKIAKEEKQQKD